MSNRHTCPACQSHLPAIAYRLRAVPDAAIAAMEASNDE